jgi:transcriptional regulator with XRE-family HTH domain
VHQVGGTRAVGAVVDNRSVVHSGADTARSVSSRRHHGRMRSDDEPAKRATVARNTAENGGTAGEVRLGGYLLSEIVRRVRRAADLSQRELAKHARISPSTVGAVEAGRTVPSLPVLLRMLNAAHYQLVAVDVDGRLVLPLQVWKDTRDGGGRRYPAHLDTILDPVSGDWWADRYGLARPPETFRRNRAYRDHERRLSQWEVRVAKYRKTRRPQLPPGWRTGDEWRADP